jgi:hypothetical protein
MNAQARTFFALGLIAVLTVAPAQSARAATTVFSTDFESGIPPEMTTQGLVTESVQGYSGLGPVGNQFSGNLLRYWEQALYDTKLTLRNLPPHDHVSVKFLFAAIDSWDGTELYQVLVDGDLRFNHWFQLASGDTSDYPPPVVGVLLSSGTNLGWTNGGYWQHDRAYNLGLEPALQDIPHTADSLVVTWRMGATSGGAASQWQGGSDESWGIDNLRVEVSSTVGVPGGPAPALALAGARPNPARGDRLTVEFTLGEGAPATLDLLDLRGRLVRHIAWAAPTAGRQAIDLARGARVAPGVYFVRLAQAGAIRVTRAAIVD